ncbi:hypothetical protein D3C81_1937300 [compost metagenome]
MRQPVEAVAAFQHGLERQQLGQVERRGFLAEHMKTRAQRLAGDGCVQVIGGDDDQQLHALVRGQRAFGRQHVLPVVVAA